MTNNNKKVLAICTQCAEGIEVEPLQETTVCKYCGTSFLTKIEPVQLTQNKLGGLESVFNFVEKQQDKKQQKINEEKRKRKEEQRKQEEQMKKMKNQLFAKEYLKRNLIIVGALFFVILIFSIGAKNSNGEAEKIVKISMPASSKDFKGRNYQEVVNELEGAGFTNVEIVVLDDLIIGFLTKDGEVEEVKVGTDTTFSGDSRYVPDELILVTYHTFPEKKEETKELVVARLFGLTPK